MANELYILAEYDEVGGVFTSKEQVAKYWERKKLDWSVFVVKPNVDYIDKEFVDYLSVYEIYKEVTKNAR